MPSLHRPCVRGQGTLPEKLQPSGPEGSDTGETECCFDPRSVKIIVAERRYFDLTEVLTWKLSPALPQGKLFVAMESGGFSLH